MSDAFISAQRDAFSIKRMRENKKTKGDRLLKFYDSLPAS